MDCPDITGVKAPVAPVLNTPLIITIQLELLRII